MRLRVIVASPYWRILDGRGQLVSGSLPGLARFQQDDPLVLGVARSGLERRR